MSQKKSEAVFRELSGVVIELHNEGKSRHDIAKSIELSGISYKDSKTLVEKITDAYKNGVDLSKQPSFLESHPSIRELVYFIGGIALVLIGSIILSLLLGVVAAIFKAIGLGGLGTFLVKMGENGAGIIMGVLGTGASSETKSLGMFIGCWVGSGLYYWWLFSTM